MMMTWASDFHEILYNPIWFLEETDKTEKEWESDIFPWKEKGLEMSILQRKWKHKL